MSPLILRSPMLQLFIMYKDLLKRYVDQITEDLKMDQMNIGEVTMLIAGKKHYWNQQLTERKIELLDLEKKKRDLIKQLTKKVQEDSPIKISKGAEVKAASGTNIIQDINEQIEYLSQIVEFLERNFRTMSNLHMDVRNIIELIKAQTM